MNSPLERHEVRLRGLQGGHRGAPADLSRGSGQLQAVTCNL
jgi:hypothetical protein